MYGFIGFQKATDLNGMWVAHDLNKITFKSVYIKLVDRLNNKTYQSNTIVVTPDAVFSKPVNYATGEYPIDLVSGDFNGDNKKDLVIDGYGSMNVLFLAGNGNGTFKDAQSLYTASRRNVKSLGSGDLNNDRKLDLIFSTNQNIYLLFGKGDGTFTGPTTIPITDSNISKIKVFDFNNDGNNDLAVLNYFNNSVSILKGNGVGSFSLYKSYPVGTQPLDIVIGDFDGDNKSDIITANSMSDDISFLKGKGNCDFENGVTLIGFEFANNLDTADFNKDGIIDLAGSRQDDAYVIWGSKTSFGSKINFYHVYGVFTGLAADDFDGDGNQDIAYARLQQDIQILKGHGDGSFEVSEYIYPITGKDSGFAITSDFNNDSKPDLAMVNRNSDNISVYINSYTYVPPTPTPIPTTTPTTTSTNNPTATATTKATITATPTTVVNTPTRIATTNTQVSITTQTPSPASQSGSNS